MPIERTICQSELEQLSAALEKTECQVQDTKKLIEIMRNYVKLEKPDREILAALVEKIVVGEKTDLGKEQRQVIQIRYRFVGVIG